MTSASWLPERAPYTATTANDPAEAGTARLRCFPFRLPRPASSMRWLRPNGSRLVTLRMVGMAMLLIGIAAAFAEGWVAFWATIIFAATTAETAKANRFGCRDIMRRQYKMLRGLYSSAAGMIGQLVQQDVIANNLANVNTSGFKRSSVSFSALVEQAGGAGDGAPVSEAAGVSVPLVIPVPLARQDTSQGVMGGTVAPTNLAIDGPGYFVVRTPHGDRFTRSGNFRLDTSGRLVAPNGDELLGGKGPIRIPGNDWAIDPDGGIRVGGIVVDKIRIEPGEGNPKGTGASLRGRVIQGRLECSNVNAIQEMVSMIATLRIYEANQRAVQSLDQTLDKVINQTGRMA
jgi:flagellar basal-body rod protein FlgG